MKKILAVIIITVFLAGAAQAGNIAMILGTDVIIGGAAGAMLGAAIATPFFMTGGSKDAGVYLTGTGWGFVCGAGVGLIYGIWNVVYYINEHDAPVKKKAYLGTEDLYLAASGTSLTLIKKF